MLAIKHQALYLERTVVRNIVFISSVLKPEKSKGEINTKSSWAER